MNIEEAKEVLEKWKDRGSDGLTDERLGYIDEWYHKKDDVAFEIAIKSLDMWNKVIDELEEYKIIGSQMECFGTTEENAKEYIPIDTALDIINKHLKETEKCKEMGRTLGENE